MRTEQTIVRRMLLEMLDIAENLRRSFGRVNMHSAEEECRIQSMRARDRSAGQSRLDGGWHWCEAYRIQRRLLNSDNGFSEVE